MGETVRWFAQATQKGVELMATINSREIVDEIIRGDGHYQGDTRVVKIVAYQNQYDGNIAYGLIYHGEDPMRYHNASACHNPLTLWIADEFKN